jgi:ABC-type glycerol-3-phosphate transport system substrate-binding protein
MPDGLNRSRFSRRDMLATWLGSGVAVIVAACTSQAPASPTAAPAATSAPAAKPTTAPAAPTTAAAPTAAPTTAAAPKPTVAATAAATTAPVAGGARTLTFWGHEDHPMDAAMAGFQQKNPDVKLDWQHLGDWLTKFKATLASGQGVPDLVWLEATDVQNFGSQGVLMDVTDKLTPIKDQFSPGKVAEVFIVKKNQYVAMPGDIGLVGLWYRPDLLAAAGVSEFSPDLTFDQFVTAAGQLQQKTGVAGFLLSSAGFSFPYEILLSQVGGSITSLDGTKVTIDDAKGVQAMTLLKQLWDTKANLDTTWLQPDYWAAVKGGKIAADFMPAWMRGFVETNVKTPDEGAGKWKVMALPSISGGVSRTAQIGGASLASTKFSKVQDLAWSFMQYSLGSQEGCTATGGWGIIPSYLPYLQSDAFTSKKSSVFGDFQFNKVWSSLAPTLSTTYARTAVFSDADQDITQNMIPMLSGDTSIADGMKALGDMVREANQRYQ